MAGARERRRAEVLAQLLVAGKAELARVGAAALSIRAVARAMDMAPSALFRHIEGRDELLTLLIIDAYDELGEYVETAEASVPREDLPGRWRAIAAAFRRWAITHPHEYALLYGSPVPNFHARADETNRAGTRVTTLLAALGREAPPRSDQPRLAPEAADFGSDDYPGLDAVTLTLGATAWTTLLGAVSAEVFQYLGPDLPYESMTFATAVRIGEDLLLGSRSA